ncbi:hypothetical protein CV770_21610 [Bradyrhizobium sp. AC87j1]|nr:hypothetical protein CV770_21610 [Bradyrhizobium sp. AC87j1]
MSSRPCVFAATNERAQKALPGTSPRKGYRRDGLSLKPLLMATYPIRSPKFSLDIMQWLLVV